MDRGGGGAMTAYIARRLALIIPTFFGITLITFMIIQLAPGSPVSLKLMGPGGAGLKAENISKELIEQTKKLYGLDKPFHEQYARWLVRMVRLDFGTSFKDHRPVSKKIAEALPITLFLNVISIVLIYLIAFPLGIYSSVHPRSFFDRGITLGLFILYSLPNFWVAMLLIRYLAGGEFLDLFPITGIISEGAEQLSLGGRIGNVLWHLVLPVITLTYGGLAFLSRFSRAQMLEVIRQDYIRTARAKGLSERVVILKHALRNALIPLLTLMSTLLPALIGGSVIVEQIFGIPGMGKLGFEAVLSRDYPTVMAIASISAFLTLISILVTDLLYVVVDPRISFGKGEDHA
jgi:peptide/nickel transport system permease protein